MFGGVSGEVLWKEATNSVALGLEVIYAIQRDPDSLLSFDDFDVVTGHASMYWDTGWHGLLTQLDLGRYLAGDWGGTLTLSRRFPNNWEVAAFATATDGDTSGIPSGDIDTGIRLTIPLQWTFPAPTRRSITVPFRNLGRDDGARLEVGKRLFGEVRAVDAQRLGETWTSFWQ